MTAMSSIVVPTSVIGANCVACQQSGGIPGDEIGKIISDKVDKFRHGI